MSIVSVSNINHSFGVEKLFQALNFSIEHNSKIGLVGKNGSGKTTLFNIFTQSLIPDSGNVHISKTAKISYLTQEPELDDSLTLRECVLQSRPDHIILNKQLIEAEQKLTQNDSQKNLDHYAQMQQRFELAGGYHFNTEMKLVLTSLNFPKNVWDMKIRNFSGGEKTRIQLATILLQPFDLLLLDEPTNHLDIEMIYWLERYLTSLDKPYLIISHDRHFLDNTITKIAEIRNYAIDIYSGNYSQYKEQLQMRMELQEKTFRKQQKKINRMEKQIDQYRIWGRARDSETMFVRAKELEKRLDKIDRTDLPKKEKKIKLNFQTEKRSGNDVYTFENMSFGFPENTLASNINLQMFYQDKIAILGTNGCGKTTFLKLLNEKMQPQSGSARKGASLQIGYYDQMHLELDDSITIMQTIWQLAPLAPKGYVFSYLAKYGFVGDEVEKQVSVLSGGEKARLYLAKLIHEKPNFLILDEPTNHLDINMISYLEDALKEFDGTIVFVSHDRYFIEKVAKKKWMFTSGTIEETSQKLDDLFFQKEKKKKNENSKLKSGSRRTNPIVLKKLSTEIEQITELVNSKTEQLDYWELEFSKPNIYNDQQKVKTLTENIKQIKKEIEDLGYLLDKLENEYLELL
ncbi:MAG: ABC-F family ATP-binding cassette domain-containing protein [Candidatus Cloacimonetes bacterium]|jgi:ATP-binding cassette, subfamily F, member 3|nr:ABC-F family ATP-binding cassette domain-containing protein [Candidatus Cloacimonadota bacterium]MBT4331636.1 ABC-F family ATP-binding cassette domain-containing protein [Candidatus Cloacimonadota bacterium]